MPRVIDSYKQISRGPAQDDELVKLEHDGTPVTVQGNTNWWGKAVRFVKEFFAKFGIVNKETREILNHFRDALKTEYDSTVVDEVLKQIGYRRLDTLKVRHVREALKKSHTLPELHNKKMVEQYVNRIANRFKARFNKDIPGLEFSQQELEAIKKQLTRKLDELCSYRETVYDEVLGFQLVSQTGDTGHTITKKRLLTKNEIESFISRDVDEFINSAIQSRKELIKLINSWDEYPIASTEPLSAESRKLLISAIASGVIHRVAATVHRDNYYRNAGEISKDVLYSKAYGLSILDAMHNSTFASLNNIDANRLRLFKNVVIKSDCSTKREIDDLIKLTKFLETHKDTIENFKKALLKKPLKFRELATTIVPLREALSDRMDLTGAQEGQTEDQLRKMTLSVQNALLLALESMDEKTRSRLLTEIETSPIMNLRMLDVTDIYKGQLEKDLNMDPERAEKATHVINSTVETLHQVANLIRTVYLKQSPPAKTPPPDTLPSYDDVKGGLEAVLEPAPSDLSEFEI